MLTLSLGSFFLLMSGIQYAMTRVALIEDLKDLASALGRVIEARYQQPFIKVQQRVELMQKVEPLPREEERLRPLAWGMSHVRSWAVWQQGLGGGRVDAGGWSPVDSLPDKTGWDKVTFEGSNANWLTYHGGGQRRAEMSLDLGEILKDLGRLEVPSGGFGFLVDGRGHCLLPDDQGGVVHVRWQAAENNMKVLLAARGLESSPSYLVDLPDPLRGLPGWTVVVSIPQVELAAAVFFPRSVVLEPLAAHFRVFVGASVFGFVVLVGVCWLASSWVSRPLHQLSQALKPLDSGHLDVPIEQVGSSLEMIEFSRRFESMRCHLAEAVERERSEAVERSRWQGELELAHNLQSMGQPGCEWLRGPGFEVAGRCQPSREVGGDFWDCFARPDGDWIVCVGDVAGKGVPGALYTQLTRLTLKSVLQRGATLEEALAEANRVIYLDNTECMFVTVVLLSISPGGQLRWARAGHPSPLLWRAGVLQELDAPGRPPLGILPEWTYASQSLQLERADSLLIYSDGLDEAENGKGEFFGMARVIDQAPWADPDRLLEVVDAFRAGHPPNDDTTLVVIRCDGPTPGQEKSG